MQPDLWDDEGLLRFFSESIKEQTSLVHKNSIIKPTVGEIWLPHTGTPQAPKKKKKSKYLFCI